MVAIQELQPGKRYTFYENAGPFRGTFIENRTILTGNNLLFTYVYVDTEERINGRWVRKIIREDFIQNVETLQEVLQNRSVIPDDVIHVIDSYV
jgi:hypothetical protein